MPAPVDPAFFATLLAHIGHSAWLGMRFRDYGSDWIELELPWRADLVGEGACDVLASGPIVALIDNAAGLAVSIRAGRPVSNVTIDLRVDYMRAARPGASVVAHCRCTRLTRSVAFVSGFAHDGDPDDPVCQATASFMLIGDGE